MGLQKEALGLFGLLEAFHEIALRSLALAMGAIGGCLVIQVKSVGDCIMLLLKAWEDLTECMAAWHAQNQAIVGGRRFIKVVVEEVSTEVLNGEDPFPPPSYENVSPFFKTMKHILIIYQVTLFWPDQKK